MSLRQYLRAEQPTWLVLTPVKWVLQAVVWAFPLSEVNALPSKSFFLLLLFLSFFPLFLFSLSFSSFPFFTVSFNWVKKLTNSENDRAKTEITFSGAAKWDRHIQQGAVNISTRMTVMMSRLVCLAEPHAPMNSKSQAHSGRMSAVRMSRRTESLSYRRRLIDTSLVVFSK